MSESITLHVTGMKCGGCEATLKTKLAELPGILSVSPSHQTGQLTVEFELDAIDIETIEDAVIDAGFSVD